MHEVCKANIQAEHNDNSYMSIKDHPEFIENVGDPWKSTGPGAAIARGPEDNLVGDSGHKMQGNVCIYIGYYYSNSAIHPFDRSPIYRKGG